MFGTFYQWQSAKKNYNCKVIDLKRGLWMDSSVSNEKRGEFILAIYLTLK